MHRPDAAARARGSRHRLPYGALALLLLGATSALSQTPPPADPGTRNQQPLGPEEPETEGGIWQRDRLLGDLGGLRTRLADAGITLTLQETSEVLGNVTGGVRTGAVYEGATLMGLAVDAERAIGVPGGTFNVSAYQIHGRGLSANNLHNLNTASGIEATRATRLFELWYEQKLLNDTVSVRIGQQAADTEFQVSSYAGLFVNSAFGWPTLAAVDLPSGGPAYPLATPGVRLKVQPREDLAFLLGVYSGNPAPAGEGDPQLRNNSGTSFVLDEGVFVIGEVQYLDQRRRGGGGAAGHLQAGSLVQLEPVRRPALRQRRAVTGRSRQDRGPAPAHQQLEHVHGRRPDGLAQAGHQGPGHWRVRAHQRNQRRPQSGEPLRQCRRDLEGRDPRSRGQFGGAGHRLVAHRQPGPRL